MSSNDTSKDHDFESDIGPANRQDGRGGRRRTEDGQGRMNTRSHRGALASSIGSNVANDEQSKAGRSSIRTYALGLAPTATDVPHGFDSAHVNIAAEGPSDTLPTGGIVNNMRLPDARGRDRTRPSSNEGIDPSLGLSRQGQSARGRGFSTAATEGADSDSGPNKKSVHFEEENLADEERQAKEQDDAFWNRVEKYNDDVRQKNQKKGGCKPGRSNAEDDDSSRPKRGRRTSFKVLQRQREKQMAAEATKLGHKQGNMNQQGSLHQQASISRQNFTGHQNFNQQNVVRRPQLHFPVPVAAGRHLPASEGSLSAFGSAVQDPSVQRLSQPRISPNPVAQRSATQLPGAQVPVNHRPTLSINNMMVPPARPSGIIPSIQISTRTSNQESVPPQLNPAHDARIWATIQAVIGSEANIDLPSNELSREVMGIMQAYDDLNPGGRARLRERIERENAQQRDPEENERFDLQDGNSL